MYMSLEELHLLAFSCRMVTVQCEKFPERLSLFRRAERLLSAVLSSALCVGLCVCSWLPRATEEMAPGMVRQVPGYSKYFLNTWVVRSRGRWPGQ